MKLVSKEKVIEFIETEIDAWGDELNMDSLLLDIHEMEEVEALPVRRGHWRETMSGGLTCSACGKCRLSKSFNHLKHSFKYCPSCGALMSDE